MKMRLFLAIVLCVSVTHVQAFLGERIAAALPKISDLTQTIKSKTVSTHEQTFFDEITQPPLCRDINCITNCGDPEEQCFAGTGCAECTHK